MKNLATSGRQQHGEPVYLRDLVEIERGYDSPARFMTKRFARRQPQLQRGRANPIDVQMVPAATSANSRSIDGKLVS